MAERRILFIVSVFISVKDSNFSGQQQTITTSAIRQLLDSQKIQLNHLLHLPQVIQHNILTLNTLHRTIVNTNLQTHLSPDRSLQCTFLCSKISRKRPSDTRIVNEPSGLPLRVFQDLEDRAGTLHKILHIDTESLSLAY